LTENPTCEACRQLPHHGKGLLHHGKGLLRDGQAACPCHKIMFVVSEQDFES
jgi:hypothetical protein